METACPGEPEKVQLLKAGIGNLEVSWNPVPTGMLTIVETYLKYAFDFQADSYILQIQRFEAPVEQTPSTPPVLPVTSQPSNLPLPSIPASLFASKSPQSGRIDLFLLRHQYLSFS